MNPARIQIVLLSLFLLGACQNRETSNSQLLKEAGEIHNEAMALSEKLEQKVEALDSSAVPKDSIHVWKELIVAWEREVVEVPGNESHSAHAHHNHDHKILEVTPEQMLVIQKELHSSLKQIESRVNRSIKK